MLLWLKALLKPRPHKRAALPRAGKFGSFGSLDHDMLVKPPNTFSRLKDGSVVIIDA